MHEIQVVARNRCGSASTTLLSEVSCQRTGEGLGVGHDENYKNKVALFQAVILGVGEGREKS